MLELTAEQARLWRDELCPALAAEGIRVGRLPRRHHEELAELGVGVRPPDLPGPHAARRRPGTAVPVHLGPVAQPRRARARPRVGRGALRARQGPRGPAALRRRRRARAADSARVGDRALPPLALSGDGDRRADGVPPDARRRHGDLGRRRRPARGRRDGAAQAPLRRRGADRGLELDLAAMLGDSRSASLVAASSVYPIRGLLDLADVGQLYSLDRPDLKYDADARTPSAAWRLQPTTTSSPRSPSGTSSSSTPTTRSRRVSSRSFAPRRPTSTSSRSRPPSTARVTTRRWPRR